MIAISYRRQDSLPIAGRLYDRLQSEFGRENVFMDFDSIPYGIDFREHIRDMIDQSKLVIAIIGPDWFGRRRGKARRIDDPGDFVRLEIAYALQRGVPLIPVLINDTRMPKAKDLPSDIEGLAFRNALTLDAGIDFHHHTDRLIAGINRLVIEAARLIAAESRKPETLQPETPAPPMSGQPPPPDVLPPVDKTPPAPAKPSYPIEHSKGETPRKESVKASLLEDLKSPIRTEPQKPPTPPSPTKPSPPQPSASVLEPASTLSGESHLLTDPASDDKTPPPSKTRPPTYLPPAVSKSSATPPPDKKPDRDASVKKWSTAILLGWTSIKLEISKRRNLLVFAGAAMTAILLLISILYVETSRSRARLQTGTENAAPEDNLRQRGIPRNNSPSPVATASTASPSAVTSATPSPTLAIASPQPTTREEPPINPKKFARSRFAFAKEALDRGYFATAGAFIDQADASDPDQPSIINLRGEILIKQEKLDLAEAAFRKALELDPSFQEAQSNLARLLSARTSAEAQKALPSPPQDGGTSQVAIEDFVRQFVSVNQSQDVDAIVASYSESVDYFDNGRRDRAYIKADVATYVQQWPIRRDFIDGNISIEEEGPHQEYAATFKLNFYAEDTQARWRKGEFALRLNVNIVDGAPKISGISEQVLQQHRGRNAKAFENRQKIAQPGLLQAPPPSYPREAESAGASGSGRFAIDFDDRGNPKSVNIVQSTGNRILDANTISTLKTWHAVAGRPGKIVVPITYTKPKPKRTPPPRETPARP